MMRYFFAPTQNRFDSIALILIFLTLLIQGWIAGLIVAVGTAFISAHYQHQVEKKYLQELQDKIKEYDSE